MSYYEWDAEKIGTLTPEEQVIWIGLALEHSKIGFEGLNSESSASSKFHMEFIEKSATIEQIRFLAKHYQTPFFSGASGWIDPVALAALRRRDLPNDLVSDYALHSDANVRFLVSTLPDLPEDLELLLSSDPDDNVRAAIRLRRELPYALLLTTHGKPSWSWLPAIQAAVGLDYVDAWLTEIRLENLAIR
jgi:hypothetical protein